MTNPNKTAEILREARSLMSAVSQSSCSTRTDTLLGWVVDLLTPLAAEQNPEAVWILSEAKSQLSDARSDRETAEKEHLLALMDAANSGISEAQYFASLHFFDAGDKQRSFALCAKAAAAGHTAAMWCHGLDLLSGSGGARDEAKGLKFIEQAAHKRFEGAIRFMADALALGQHGFDVDRAKAAEWQRLLSAPDLIRY